MPDSREIPTVRPLTDGNSSPFATPDSASPPLFPLNRMRAGCVVIIKRLTATPEINQRLREMGFGEEQKVKVITLQNNVLCQVCNARLGLSAKLAETILVEQVGTRKAA